MSVLVKVKRTLTTKLIVVLALSVFAYGCASSGAPPIESREAPPSRRINIHEVQAGETLYSIAWRYETDYRDMARVNGLREPYDLSRGQRLKIYDDGAAPIITAANPASQRAAPVRTAPVRTPATTRTSSSSGAVSAPAVRPAVSVPSTVGDWAWPVKGRMTSAFGADSRTKGIVIDPGAETLVKAAADGVVVYAGTGIRGIGNLLIVKHSNLFLSAYAYNSELLAKEGDQVRSGQSIARVGKNTDGSPRVYFEIRRDGKPVDPIRYLPKR